MELNIGLNIKRLRNEKGFTQEQLAERLNVSSAAVSKWEAKNSYPDITLLFPLAEIFGVSVDELLGYDREKEKAEINKLISEYRKLHVHGDFDKAKALIEDGIKKYPHDYVVINTYMWEKAGGTAGNNTQTLITHKDELTQLCNSILDGCTRDDLRAQALNMKAKLLHAQGETERAFEVLSVLPSRQASAMKEQLFGRDTAEYRYWNRRNCYGLLDEMAIKLARTVRFDPDIPKTEKIKILENMGESFTSVSNTVQTECFCIAEQSVYAILAGMLTAEDRIDDVIRIREKQFASMEKMTEVAKHDQVMRDGIEATYKTDSPVEWAIDRLLYSPHPQLADLRENKKYMEMLLKYRK